jgi:hypothetical protein
MRGTNGGSRYAMPFRIIPDLGQRPENSVQSSTKQRCHVFQHNASGLQFANHANGLKEQPRPLPVKPCPSSGVGNILAGESAADDIDWFKVMSSTLQDIALPMHARPMFCQHLAGEIVNFHLPLAGHTGPLKAQIKPANACK